MKRINLAVPLLVLVMGLSSSVRARTIYFGSEVEVVTLPAGDDTLLKFPSEVRTITRAQRYEIQPADPEQPSYSVLRVRPRFSSGANNVAFILNDGTIIRTKLTVVSTASPEKIDSVYEFKSKDGLISQEEGKAGAALSDLELMKAMIRGDEVPGYDIKSVSRSVTPGFRGVTTTLIKVYTGNRFNGYVFEIVNRTKDKRLLVNIQNLMLGEPNQAIFSNVDTPVVDPEHGPEKQGRSRTLVRIVAKPTSIYSKLILPIETVLKK